MALVLKDRVKETTTTAGTGTVTLAGASTGYQSFSAIGNANTTYYCIAGQGTAEWEVGIGTYTASGTTLSRDTILASSNSGSVVTFSAGTKDVFVVYPADKSINLDASGNATALGTPASCTVTNFTGTASININGTVGATTPSTGAFTTLSVNSNNISADNSLGFRNRIINGDMRIDQRNGGAAVTINTTANTYTIDRWVATGQSADGVFTVQRDTTVPTGAGFTNSAKITVTTADASIGASQIYIISQFIEGFNTADLQWGTASAKTITLSFWVRSSVTGTFSGALNNSDNSRSYVFTYVINSANTYEYKTVTISGDTSGTWLTDNGRGIAVRFSLGTGSTNSGTAGSWSGSTLYAATGAVNLISTVNATWYITGVQLEVGSVATPFERRPYTTELQLCQRYLPAWRDDGSGTSIIGNAYVSSATLAVALMTLPVTARVAPTGVVVSNASHIFFGSPISLTPTAINLTSVQSNSVVSFSGDVTGATTGYAGLVRFQNTAGYVYFTGCEL